MAQRLYTGSCINYGLRQMRWVWSSVIFACLIGSLALWCTSYVINFSLVNQTSKSLFLVTRGYVVWNRYHSISRFGSDYLIVVRYSSDRADCGERYLVDCGALNFESYNGRTQAMPFHRYSNLQGQRLPIIGTNEIILPAWFPALLFLLALITLKTFRSFRKYCLLSRGRCANCGYDLRGSSQECPECGGLCPRRNLDQSVVRQRADPRDLPASGERTSG